MSVTHVSNDFLKLIDQVAEDGELTFREIRQLAVWINENKEGRKLWPATVFIKLLQNAFEDGKSDANDANEVGKLIQAVRREWSRNIVPAKPISTESVVAKAISRARPAGTQHSTGWPLNGLPIACVPEPPQRLHATARACPGGALTDSYHQSRE